MALLQTVMGKPISEWIGEFPILSDMIEKKETVWLNENALPFHEAIAQSELQAEDIRDASDRLKRFANYFKKVFPETAQNGGLIESPLRAAGKMQKNCVYIIAKTFRNAQNKKWRNSKMYENHRIFETMFCGKKLVAETGKYAELANGSAMIRYGDTAVLAAVTASAAPRDGIDFFPLSVEFQERLYAVGKIPGSFLKREGRPSDKAVLSSRVIDRPIRPLSPRI